MMTSKPKAHSGPGESHLQSSKLTQKPENNFLQAFYALNLPHKRKEITKDRKGKAGASGTMTMVFFPNKDFFREQRL